MIGRQFLPVLLTFAPMAVVSVVGCTPKAEDLKSSSNSSPANAEEAALEPPPTAATLLPPDGCVWISKPTRDCPVGDAAAYQAWVTGNDPVSVKNEKSGIQLVWVPGGSFLMGSDSGSENEQPVHRVELNGFWIARTPVTAAQWRTVTGQDLPYCPGDEHPAVSIMWVDAALFCGEAGLAAPTEAQWEYAARGPDSRVYPWGDQWDASKCQSDEDRHGYDLTAPVGSFPGNASWCGALDMAGNVLEWCRDWMDEGFYSSPAATQPDPLCSDDSSGECPIRGGSYKCGADECRSARRRSRSATYTRSTVGFRPTGEF